MNDTELVEGRHGCRAPVNGMIVGTITGAVLALAFLLPYFGSGADGRIYLVAPGVVAIYAVGGWLTGLWGRKLCACENPRIREKKVRGLGAVTATLVGSITTGAYDLYWFARPRVNNPFLDPFFDIKYVLSRLVSLIIFPCIGWILGVFGSSLHHEKTSFIPKMTAATMAALFLSLVVWRAFSILTLILFHL